MSLKHVFVGASVVLGLGFLGWAGASRLNLDPARQVGDVVDSFHEIPVYYNGGVAHVEGRHTAADGYNLGLKWQCVEFVKRYYHDRFGLRMPDERGNARDFFNTAVDNGTLNVQRGLIQYVNGAGDLPAEEDLVVFGPWVFNRFGHVAIVTQVGPDFVEIIQQNPGVFGHSRERFPIVVESGVARVDAPRLRGWLHLPPSAAASSALRTPSRPGGPA